jgi:phosphoribosylformylglycinamidine cyclo-ligase
VFEVISRLGGVPAEEMARTFNRGIGFCLVVAEAEAGAVMALLAAGGRPARPIGEIVAGERGVDLI